MLYVRVPLTCMDPVAPEDVIPAVCSVINPAPELNVNVPVLPSKILVPILSVLPELTVKLISLAIVPPVFVYTCVPVLANSTLPRPAALEFSKVPPESVKLPLSSNIAVPVEVKTRLLGLKIPEF